MQKVEIVEPALCNTRKGNKQITQKKNWFFTWNNYDKESIEILETLFNNICEKYVFQEEKGEEGTPHLQGSIVLKKKMRWSEFKLPKEIHWEGTKSVDKSFKYCSKEMTKNGKCYTKGFKIKKPLKVKIEKLYKWEKFIVDLCKEEPDDRSVYWFWDEEGGAGKTEFCKWYWNNNKDRSIICQGGGAKDIACMFANLVKEVDFDLNDDITVLFNLARSTEGISYKAIESVKDGLLFSPKYESSTLVFNRPHVIIFSNQLPDYNKLSKDRWITYKILKNGKFELYEN